MAETSPPQVHDLLILTDATASMGEYLRALNESLPQIISVSTLTGSFARIGVLAYRDYCEEGLIEWSGWFGRDGDIERDELLDFTRNLRPDHGGDWAEATKTGLAKAYSVMREEAKTVILLYADAPPHMGGWDHGKNYEKEISYLTGDSSELGPSAGLFADWVSAAQTLNGEGQGTKVAQVFPIVCSYTSEAYGPFIYLARQTKGTCLEMKWAYSQLISKLTMSLLLAWMGTQKVGGPEETFDDAFILGYYNIDNLDELENEVDPKVDYYFLRTKAPTKSNILTSNMCREVVANEIQLRASITPRERPVTDFAKRYANDPEYQTTVIENLQKIIREDVTSIALNPVFGSLWRAVCNDRRNEARDHLIADLGASIQSITSSDTRSMMQSWLAESYNYAADITAMIEEVPAADRYPCVFMDPTQDWTLPGGEDGASDASLSLKSLTRDQLMELGRSCDSKILRRLGTVLTTLTYVSDRASMPAHVMAMSEEDLPRIPMALAKPQHNTVFWKILLHLVVPGTKLSSRPAALLAALSIRMGMRPLTDAADNEMAAWKDNWNNIDIPETWNFNCLSLILDADKDFEARRRTGRVGAELKEASFLSNADRHLFETLVDYSMSRANLNTTLTARVGWKPTKSKVPIGPLVTCKACHFPRSVSMMAHKEICGICIIPEELFVHGRAKAEAVLLNVSNSMSESSEASWVECSVTTCRAQYVVYNVDGLNVRPKCHFCRVSSNGGAPWIECRKCLNRMIWPDEYRPLDRDATKDFVCTSCDSGQASIVDAETTPAALCMENGDQWFLRHGSKLRNPLGDNRSLFKMISEFGVDTFATEVEILPHSNAELRMDGKLVQNVAELKSSLKSWIKSRRAEAGLCSLCFSEIKKSNLRSACGRSGCAQRICTGCQTSWYGLNARGRVINTAALCCPFCRRTPAPRAVPRSDLVFLGNLRAAVEDFGAWIYGWCNSCGVAKRMLERVCAQAAPADVRAWECEDCIEEVTSRKPNAARPSSIRHCPRCDVPTEKLSGCDHISCRCGAHWCFSCGKQCNPDDIYEHMTSEHGSFYSVLGAEDDSDGEMDMY